MAGSVCGEYEAGNRDRCSAQTWERSLRSSLGPEIECEIVVSVCNLSGG